MTKRTPGRWRTCPPFATIRTQYTRVSPHTGRVTDLRNHIVARIPASPHRKADARLFVAAPDMLEALHNALEAGLPEPAAAAVRAAIAKAERGEQNGPET